MLPLLVIVARHLYFQAVRHLSCLLVLGLAALAAGCASIAPPSERADRARVLNQQLVQLDQTVDPAEATQLASTAVEHAAELARDYRPVRPAWFNNMLINSGLRDRGLCYHWTNDLFAQLHQLGLRTLELHLAVAGRATAHEHNCIVVTARDQPFEQGIVLDAWRHGGRLWSVRVAEDKKYPWEPLPPAYTPKELQPLLNP